MTILVLLVRRESSIKPLDETSGILKDFTTSIENQLNHEVKIIRCDNGTEFKNYEINQFYEIKGIKREFSNARTPQQNGVAERKNRTLIEAARNMLADLLLPIPFWAKAVNTAYYVQNMVLVSKPHNKTPYELLIGRTPIISCMRPFGCLVTILNTLDHLGKFNGKADEGFLVGYSIYSKAFRVYNSRTRKVEKNLHVNFFENKPNVTGSGPEWLFDIDSLTNSMNYQPVSAGNRTNGNACSDINSDAGQAGKEKVLDQEYILLPLLSTCSYVPSSHEEDESSPKDDAGKNPTVNVTSNKDGTFQRTNDEWDFSTPITVNAASSSFSHPAALDDYSKMPNLEYTGIFNDAYDDRDEGVEADYNNLETVEPKKATQALDDESWLSLLYVKNGDVTYDEVFASVARIEAISVKSASTPMETHKPLSKDADGTDVDVHLYRSMISSLMYSTSSRLDIMFAVCAYSRFQVQPKVSHMHAVKRIFRYLKVQPTLGLWYPKDSPLELIAYSDSDYAGASLDRKSITGGCQFLGSRLISWQCKKQTSVANSTIEVEYIAASNCCGQVLWLQNQLLDYGYNFMQTKIHVDNESAICVVKILVCHSKTKHIEIRHHFIRYSYEKRLIEMEKIHTNYNVVDILTKAFDVTRFQFLIASIGLLNP
nr:putative ribonuclease H-like domain-containing protein [Tanacetum cinerariifolium]